MQKAKVKAWLSQDINAKTPRPKAARQLVFNKTSEVAPVKALSSSCLASRRLGGFALKSAFSGILLRVSVVRRITTEALTRQLLGFGCAPARKGQGQVAGFAQIQFAGAQIRQEVHMEKLFSSGFP